MTLANPIIMPGNMPGQQPATKPRAKRFEGPTSKRKAIARARIAPQPLRQDANTGIVCESLPIRTVNPNNGSHGSHWGVTKRREREHNVTRYCLAAVQPMPPLPWLVRLTRCGRGTRKMDFDGLVASLKAVRDEIAACAGVDDGDEKQIEFEYAQRHEPAYSVAVAIETRREL
jgi:hypothetical protein